MKKDVLGYSPEYSRLVRTGFLLLSTAFFAALETGCLSQTATAKGLDYPIATNWNREDGYVYDQTESEKIVVNGDEIWLVGENELCADIPSAPICKAVEDYSSWFEDFLDKDEDQTSEIVVLSPDDVRSVCRESAAGCVKSGKIEEENAVKELIIISDIGVANFEVSSMVYAHEKLHLERVSGKTDEGDNKIEHVEVVGEENASEDGTCSVLTNYGGDVYEKINEEYSRGNSKVISEVEAVIAARVFMINNVDPTCFKTSYTQETFECFGGYEAIYREGGDIPGFMPRKEAAEAMNKAVNHFVESPIEYYLWLRAIDRGNLEESLSYTKKAFNKDDLTYEEALEYLSSLNNAIIVYTTESYHQYDEVIVDKPLNEICVQD